MQNSFLFIYRIYFSIPHKEALLLILNLYDNNCANTVMKFEIPAVLEISMNENNFLNLIICYDGLIMGTTLSSPKCGPMNCS